MNVLMLVGRAWARWTAEQLVLLLYVMLVLNLFESHRASVVLTGSAVVLNCLLALLCRLTGSYGLLRAGFVATCLNLLVLR